MRSGWVIHGAFEQAWDQMELVGWVRWVHLYSRTRALIQLWARWSLFARFGAHGEEVIFGQLRRFPLYDMKLGEANLGEPGS